MMMDSRDRFRNRDGVCYAGNSVFHSSQWRLFKVARRWALMLAQQAKKELRLGQKHSVWWAKAYRFAATICIYVTVKDVNK